MHCVFSSAFPVQSLNYWDVRISDSIILRT